MPGNSHQWNRLMATFGRWVTMLRPFWKQKGVISHFDFLYLSLILSWTHISILFPFLTEFSLGIGSMEYGHKPQTVGKSITQHFFLVTMSIYWFGLRSMVSLGLQMDYRTELYSDSISFDLTRQLCWHSYIDNHSDTMLSTSANLITKHFSHHFIVIKCKWSCELLWEGDCHGHVVNSVFLH